MKQVRTGLTVECTIDRRRDCEGCNKYVSVVKLYMRAGKIWMNVGCQTHLLSDWMKALRPRARGELAHMIREQGLRRADHKPIAQTLRDIKRAAKTLRAAAPNAADAE